jgi:hypothetical protein
LDKSQSRKDCLKLWMKAFYICQGILRTTSKQELIVDSFPVPVCQTHKSFRCKLLRGKVFHGYTASKKAFFWGIKVHMIVDLNGVPIEFLFTPGSESDTKAFRRFHFNFPEKSTIYGDKAYNDYVQEDLLKELCKIQVVAKRKKNSKRPHSPSTNFLLSLKRNRIETAFSSIVGLMPRCIRAATTKGFYLKVFFFILGHTMKFILPSV